MTLLIDDAHFEYSGYWKPGAICHLRVYAATEASGGVPVVIASELVSNRNTSITNRCEYLAAQVLARVLGLE